MRLTTLSIFCASSASARTASFVPCAPSMVLLARADERTALSLIASIDNDSSSVALATVPILADACCATCFTVPDRWPACSVMANIASALCFNPAAADTSIDVSAVAVASKRWLRTSRF